MNKIDSPERFDELPKEQQDFLLKWIANNLRPIQTINKRHTSYNIKHWIEEEYTDVYY